MKNLIAILCLYCTASFSQIKQDIEYSLRFIDTSINYTLTSDHYVMVRPISHYGKGFLEVAGKWQLKDSVVSFALEKKEKKYKPDSVLTIHFLVGLELKEEWNIIKTKAIEDLEKNELYQAIISDTTKSQLKEWVVRKSQFQAFDEYILNKNILIELPLSRPKSKKKKK